MTSAQQDREFLDGMLHVLRNDRLLETAIEWIQNNLYPEDVFSDKDLDQWAEENEYVKASE